MKCGVCLLANSETVELVESVCPKCKADYTRPATEDEIPTQWANIKPITPLETKPSRPIIREEPKKVEWTGKSVSIAPPPESKLIEDEQAVIDYLRNNGHTSEETALGAMKASTIFGKGIAYALAKQGILKTSGVKRGARYWIEPQMS